MYFAGTMPSTMNMNQSSQFLIPGGVPASMIQRHLLKSVAFSVVFICLFVGGGDGSSVARSCCCLSARLVP